MTDKVKRGIEASYYRTDVERWHRELNKRMPGLEYEWLDHKYTLYAWSPAFDACVIVCRAHRADIGQEGLIRPVDSVVAIFRAVLEAEPS